MRRCFARASAAAAVVAIAAIGCREREVKADAAKAAPDPLLAMPTFTTPRCDSAPSVFCFADTAVEHPIDTDPGSWIDADWLVFVSAGDSVAFAVSDGDKPWKWQAADFLVPRSMGGDTTNLAKGYARWYRAPWDGVARLWVDLFQAGFRDTVPYVVRIRPYTSVSSSTLKPTGRVATINLVSRNEATLFRFSIIPLSIAASRPDRARWTVWARQPRVVLVPDSLYEVCRVPCVRPDTLLLKPGGNLPWHH